MQEKTKKYAYICYSKGDEASVDYIKNKLDSKSIPYFICDLDFKNKEENAEIIKEKIINSACFVFVYSKNIFSNLDLMKDVMFAFENYIPIITCNEQKSMRKLEIYDYLLYIFGYVHKIDADYISVASEILSEKIKDIFDKGPLKPHNISYMKDKYCMMDRESFKPINELIILCVNEYISLVNFDYATLENFVPKLKELVIKINDEECYKAYNRFIMHYDVYKDIKDKYDDNARLHYYYLKQLIICMFKFIEGERFGSQDDDYKYNLKNTY